MEATTVAAMLRGNVTRCPQNVLVASEAERISAAAAQVGRCMLIV